MAFGINKALQKHLSNVFITIVRYDKEWQLYCKIIKNKAIIKKIVKIFPVVGDEELGKELEEYLDGMYQEYSYVYTSYLLNSMGQGAISGTTHIDFEKNSVDIKNISQLIVDKKWSIYASYIDIKWAKNIFQNSGIDFVFSPFALIHFLCKESLISQKPILYFFNHQDFIAISIFELDVLLFASFFKTSTDKGLVGEVNEVGDWEDASEEQGVGTLIELDNIDNDDGSNAEFSSLDDLEDLDDLDSSLDGMDDEGEVSFSDIDDDKKELGHFQGEVRNDDLELYGRDILVYKYLTSSIQEFYHNNLYESDFISKIVLYDGYEVSSDLIDLIENELMIEIEITKIDINEELCNMAIHEVFK